MSRTFRFLAVLGAAISVAVAEEGRLPGGVHPRSYAIHLQPDLEHQSFSGRVEIEVELDAPQHELVLNAVDLKVTGATADGKALAASTDAASQQLKLTGAELAAGRHTIAMDFSGTLSERPEGLYITRYQLPDGTWQKALATQMEPVDARRMFPCWDEPADRAEFQLTAIVPAKHSALFNMPIVRETPLEGGAMKEVEFGKTPPMASYLVAFVSGELESIEDEVEGTKLRILSTPGHREQMRYAMEVTKKVLPYYHEYFGVKYPLPKLDQVSFPSAGAGGMENWGCIVYADSALLFDSQQSAQITRERVFNVVAHEIAHQWFGDLVTMKWWNDLWLNEGFASWMATKASDHFNPAWKSWARAANGKEGAMRLDARATTHPIQQDVKTAGEAEQAFDEITYQKGQALLRMLETWLGEDKFRAGLRWYFKQHAYGNTVTADLWQALGEASGEKVGALASGWTEQPGFPMVTVRSAGEGQLEFTQERFTIHQKDPKALTWQVPIFLSSPNFQSVQSTFVLREHSTRVPVKLPLLLNTNAAGYFRVNYAGGAWKSMLPILPSLAEVDQLAVLNDTWACVQAEQEPLTTWLELAQQFRESSSPLVTEHLLGVIGALEHLARGTPSEAPFDGWAREFLAAQWQRLGWAASTSEEPATANLRGDLIVLLGKLGDASVRNEAHARLLKFLDQPASLPGDLREAVLRVGAIEADAELWERIHARALKTADTEQKFLLYGALSAVSDPALAKRALETALSGELPAKTAERMVGRVDGEGRHAELAWEFAGEHLPALLALCTAGDAHSFLARLARQFTEAARAEELESITKTRLTPDCAHDTAIAADEIRFQATLKDRLLPELAKWIEAHKSGR